MQPESFVYDVEIRRPESQSRRITAFALVAVLSCGLLCSISYVAGRASASDVSQAAPARAQKAPVRDESTPQVSIVDMPPVQVAPEPVPLTEPVDGTYLQLESVSPGIGEVMAQGLILNGIDAKLAPGPSSAAARVLVGPLEGVDLDRMRERLENMGFRPFLRRVINNTRD
jgi:cell division protein FtsN